MREETDRILLEAAAAGASLDDLAALAACAIETWRARQALGKKAGPEDNRTEGQRFHDALQLAWASLPRG